MNLANNITMTDPLLHRLIQYNSDVHVTSDPAEIPDFEDFIRSMASYHLISEKYTHELQSILDSIEEAHYFIRKTDNIAHRVLVIKLTEIDFYFLVKDDHSICCCVGSYLAGELAVQLRLSSFNDTEE